MPVCCKEGLLCIKGRREVALGGSHSDIQTNLCVGTGGRGAADEEEVKDWQLGMVVVGQQSARHSTFYFVHFSLSL
jgi:hypothetical protein